MDVDFSHDASLHFESQAIEENSVSNLYVECNLCSLFLHQAVCRFMISALTCAISTSVIHFSLFFLFTIPQIGSLIIESTRKKDSGNYSCSPSNSPPITVSLHVINGKSELGTMANCRSTWFHTAAMQIPSLYPLISRTPGSRWQRVCCWVDGNFNENGCWVAHRQNCSSALQRDNSAGAFRREEQAIFKLNREKVVLNLPVQNLFSSLLEVWY